MAARKIKDEWWVDFRFQRERIRRKSPLNTKQGAENFEYKLREQLLKSAITNRKEAPTFDEWFTGRF